MDEVFQVDRVVRVAVFLFLNSAIGIAAWRLACAMLKKESLAERALAAFALYFAAVVIVCAATGFAGLLAIRWVVIFAVIVTGVLLALSVVIRRKTCGDEPEETVAVSQPDVIGAPIIIFAGLTVAALAFMFLWSVTTPPPPGGDGYIYHLFFPATWLQQGRIGYVALPYGAQAATYYPLNTELYYLWLMLPFHEDFMTNVAQWFALVFASTAVFCLARRLGAGRGQAVMGACCSAMLPGMVQQAGVARVDIFFSLWFISTLYFIYRWRETDRAAHLALAGICWGLFVGTKSLGVLFSVCLVPAFISAAIPRGAKKAFAAALIVFAAAIVFGGFWYVRNWIVVGNPLYPLNIAAGGATLFAGAYGGGAMETFHTSDARELLRIAKLFLGFGPGVFLALCCAAAFAGVVANGSTDCTAAVGAQEPQNSSGRVGMAKDAAARAWLLYVLFIPVAVLALFWFVNPHNNLTNGRFLFPAFTLVCVYPAIAATCTKKPWVGAVLMWVAPLAFLAGALQPGCDHLAKMLPDIVSALAGNDGQMLSPAMWALRCLSVAIVFSAACGIFILKKKKTAAAGICAAAVLLFAAGFYLTWNYYGNLKYVWLSNAGVAGQGWSAFEKSVGDGVTVANVGNERAYPLFGAGLRNRVVMVNVDGRRDAQFHDYERAARRAGRRWNMASERPQLHRAGADPAAWMNNLRDEGVQLLFCTNLEPIAMRFMEHTPDGFPVEVGWMRQHPDSFRLMYELRGDAGGGDTTAVEIYAFRTADAHIHFK